MKLWWNCSLLIILLAQVLETEEAQTKKNGVAKSPKSKTNSRVAVKKPATKSAKKNSKSTNKKPAPAKANKSKRNPAIAPTLIVIPGQPSKGTTPTTKFPGGSLTLSFPGPYSDRGFDSGSPAIAPTGVKIATPKFEENNEEETLNGSDETNLTPEEVDGSTEIDGSEPETTTSGTRTRSAKRKYKSRKRKQKQESFEEQFSFHTSKSKS